MAGTKSRLQEFCIFDASLMQNAVCILSLFSGNGCKSATNARMEAS